MKQHQNNFLILLSLAIISLLFLSACSSSITDAQNQTSTSSPSSTIPTQSDANAPAQEHVVSALEYLIKFGNETRLDIDGNVPVVKITGASSKGQSVIISVKQGAGENIKQVGKNQVISFGQLRMCISDVVVKEDGSDIHAYIIPTYSQQAVSWFSMATPKDEEKTCYVFGRAVTLSEKSNGAATFFAEQLKSVADVDFVRAAYFMLLGKNTDALSEQAWEFYVSKNGRFNFLLLLVASDEFKAYQDSIK